ncbi:MAG: XRE family transcriptional regulator [Clostridia bacterium]|nr:XRE family transcriptional regulator [Clostridiales bacterium]MDU7504724.1 XRE family transcriptional regulator [Clostridia bacterium]
MGLEKINEIRKEKRMDLATLAELSGVPYGTLSKITAGITKDPKLETVKSIARTLGVTIDVFDDAPSRQQAEGSDPQFTPEEKNLIKKYRGLDTHGKKAVDWIAEHELNRLQGIESPIGGIIENATTAYTKIIPFPGKVSAGLGVEALPDYDTIAGPDAADFALLVDGDSMEPRYHSGQIIYIREQPTVENGQIAVVQIQGPDDFQPQAYLKKVKITGTTAQLISLNKAYDTLTVPLDELTVLGTVI